MKATSLAQAATANEFSGDETLLVVDDSQDWIHTCTDILSEQKFNILSADSIQKALEILEKTPVDLVLTDLSMPGGDGLQLIRKIAEIDLCCAVILMTAYPSVETAVVTLKSGAMDYLIKPFSPEQLLSAVKNALDRSALRRENQFLRARLAHVDSYGDILGKSQKIQTMMEDLFRAAQMDTSVLLMGESGSGKELAARFLHRNSNRAKKHFVPINCAAIPSELLESELFGHEAGAFTGATQSRMGLFEDADRGTVFLDEIGEMPLPLQAKLLRVIEDHKMRRLGSSKERSIDIRIVSATHQNLREMIQAGKFREDLYFRLNVLTIPIPPLRERKEDILLLLQHFLKTYETKQYPAPKEITPEVKAALLDYAWPGNVRELSNLAQYFIFANRDGSISKEQLPKHFLGTSKTTQSGEWLDLLNPEIFENPFSEARGKIEEAFEKAYFERTLSKFDWNISLAAEKTGIDRRTLHRLIRKLNLKRPD